LLRLSSNTERVRGNVELANGAWKEGTALAEEAQRRYDSVSSQFKILVNRVMDLVLIIGKPLADAFLWAIKALDPFLVLVEKAVGWFDSWNDELKKWTGIIIGGTAALALMVATLVTIRAGALAAR